VVVVSRRGDGDRVSYDRVRLETVEQMRRMYGDRGTLAHQVDTMLQVLVEHVNHALEEMRDDVHREIRDGRRP